MLTEDKDGRLIFCPATSPENTFVVDGKQCAMSKYSAMFQSIVCDAFEIFIKSSAILNEDKDYREYIEKRLLKTVWLEIGKDGRILEWNDDFEESDIHHRHLSHLYALYPAKKINSPELANACRQSLEKRGDDGTGWSCAWKICLWAMLNDGDRALCLLDKMLNPVNESDISFKGGGTYPNLLNAHPPFQIDGSLGLIAGVNEMLARYENGNIVLLPALPARWKTGSVKGICVGGGFTVDISWSDGKPDSVNVTSVVGETPTMIYKNKEWK